MSGLGSSHLSDEAVAAFADGALSGAARARAARHTASCVECADAVRGQREATFALRTADSPCLPSGLLDRLRGLPEVTPVHTVPTVVLPDGTTVLATDAVPSALPSEPLGSSPRLGSSRPLGGAPMAAFVPEGRAERTSRRHLGGSALTVVALAAALAGGSATAAALSGRDAGPSGDDVPARTVQHRSAVDGPEQPVLLRHVDLSGSRDTSSGN